ncbi:phosphatidylinositol kinase [Actinorhabdospora filicis]|uniref:Phosphatidylinositol kinase n=1 Tax=Actinorhabdospora filicis TaxID=1785913 RepID=A0A9W6SNI3_9ACTN|nr:SCO1664 family protein [Actinorhabdospora filicis]GLZ79125.1 phosphatidylinositol kinase [Actinorhabdospora filicis]
MSDPASSEALLLEGELEIEGRLLEASNATLRAFVELDGRRERCVYKPIAGERPLWDFPTGTLAGREVAAYRVARAFGLDLVPPTVMREGPHGLGACQLWMDEEDEPLVAFVPAGEVPGGWHEVAAARDEEGNPYRLAHAAAAELAMMAALDVVLNNADRKGAHILRTPGGVYGVDHGLCFHPEPKLRTVLWGWAGEPLPAAVAAALELFLAAPAEPYGQFLTAEELDATRARAEKLRADGRYPSPPADRPALPWPPV